MTLNFSGWAFKNKKLIYFFIFILMLGGLMAYIKMSKLEDPAIKVKQAMVVTVYPGASAHEVELEVTDPLEKSIGEMAGVSLLQSQSMNDMSLITVELETTVQDDEVEQKWDLLRRKVSNVQSSLPESASPSVVRDDFGDVFGMFYALTGDGLNDRQLSDYAELIKREVKNIDGVTRVEIYGKRQECINISMMEDKMANLGVMPTEIIQTLRGQSASVYSGYFHNGDQRVRVMVSDRFKEVEDIENMILQGHNDDQLRIRDIAKVEKSYEDPTRNEMTYKGERSLGISIACSADHDVIKVGERVEQTIQRVSKRFPLGTECHQVFFQPERVSSAINNFLINLIESVAVVVVVLIFAMGLKSGIIIGVSLIIIVFGSFLVLGQLDGTLQRVSLAAFIIAMGMLVDNAIVIVDGILVDLKNGKRRMRAMTDIGKQTAMPLLGATLIAILAFLPIAMSPDTAGVYVKDLFIVIAVSLMLSWILALVHVPLMANRYLPNTSRKKRLEEKAADASDSSQSEAKEGWAYEILEKVLHFSLRFKVLSISIMIGLLVLSVLGYGKMKQAFFPDMEYNQLYMEYKLPEGTDSRRVSADLVEIQEYLKSREEITNITASIGGTPSRYNLVRSIATPSLSYGELIIDFTSSDALVENMDSIQDELNRRFPEAYIKLKRYNLMFKKYPIEAVFLGPDPEVLHNLSDQAMEIVEKSDKVYLPTTDWKPRVPMLSVEYNQASARESGLNRTDVAISLLAYTGGIPITKFYDGIHGENIYVKCTNSEGKEVNNIQDANVFGMMPNLKGVFNEEYVTQILAGRVKKEDIINAIIKTTPLKQVANSIDVRWEDPVVMRYNGERSQRVQCSPRPGIATEEARRSIASQIESITLPEGYSLLWEGEKKASDQSMRYLFKNFPMAIIIMIAILIMLFKDYKKPTIIFCCIPFVLIGVIPAVLLSGKSFGFVAIVGVLGLIGMIIKNGIVLMDEIGLEIRSGINPYTALIESSKSRLRAVMMAAGTTILGMLPLIPDALFGSLAVTIMGGLFVGTIITLIFIPVLYALMFKIKNQNT